MRLNASSPNAVVVVVAVVVVGIFVAFAPVLIAAHTGGARSAASQTGIITDTLRGDLIALGAGFAMSCRHLLPPRRVAPPCRRDDRRNLVRPARGRLRAALLLLVKRLASDAPLVVASALRPPLLATLTESHTVDAMCISVCQPSAARA